MLEREYKYYLDHKGALLENFENRVVVIKGDEVLGDYLTKEDALRQTVKNHELGTFLIQEISEEEISNIPRFHSRVYV